MKKSLALVTAFLMVLPAVRADIMIPVITSFAAAQLLLSIVVGIIEGFLVWFLVRDETFWRWLLIPTLVLANIVSGIIGVGFSFAAEMFTRAFGVLPGKYHGFRNIGVFFAYLVVAYILTIGIEWLVLWLFKRKHRVSGRTLLVAILAANLVSYAALTVFFFATL